MATEKGIKIIVDTGDSKKKVQAVGKSVDKLGESAKKTSKTTKSFSGGLNSAFSVLPSSIQAAINSLRAFRIALISTGVDWLRCLCLLIEKVLNLVRLYLV